LRVAIWISLKSPPFQHSYRRAEAHPLPALKEKAQFTLRESVDPPLLQRQRLLERALGSSAAIPTLTTVTATTVHGGSRGGSGNPGSEHSEVKEVSMNQIWEGGGNEQSRI
jgi:hypothetical protein